MPMRLSRLLRRVCALALTALLLFPGAGMAESVGLTPRDSDAGSGLNAEEVARGKTGGLRTVCVFPSAAPAKVPTAGLTGYKYVYTGNGSKSSPWKITGSVGTVLAYARIGHTHYAAVRVTARQSSWPSSRQSESTVVWIFAYNSVSPAITPSDSRETVFEHGDPVSFDTGVPGAMVELIGSDGDCAATARADETGYAVFDKAHTADGKDYYTSVTYSFGDYDYRAATAYASDRANLTASGGGTGREWVTGNDCATFVSRVLTAGGFAVYAPYTNSDASPGGSLRHTLSSLIGSQAIKSRFTIADFHEGDIVWGHDMGHVLYVSAVDQKNKKIHTYAHSTKSGCKLSDNGWVSINEIDAVAQMVTETAYDYSCRIADLILPASTASIEEGAFAGVAARSVHLPDACASIGAFAFKDCKNLRIIRVPKNCAIDETAFDGCADVTVYGVPGSPAERFCETHAGFSFQGK